MTTTDTLDVSEPEVAAARPLRAHVGVLDVVVLIAFALVTVGLHPVHALLRWPYWNDEAWVATLTRVPLSQMPRLASSTPIGWLALLRLVPGSGLQRARLVPLAFAAGATVVAYLFGRTLAWSSTRRAWLAGIAAAVVVMLAPMSLLRNDLKQYTADGCCALIVLTMAASAERRSDRRALLEFAVVSVALVPVSSVSAFVTVAMFAGFVLVAAFRKDWPRVRDVCVAGGAVAAVIALFFATVVLPNDSALLRQYWKQFYLHGSPLTMLSTTAHRLSDRASQVAMPGLVLTALVIVGVVVLVRLGQTAIGVAFVVLWVEAIVLAALRRYPLLDGRASFYLLITTLVVAAIGAVGLILFAARAHVAVGAVVAIALLVGFGVGARPHIRQLNIPGEDVRVTTQYVAAHASPRDVIVVNSSGTWGFAYYWPRGSIRGRPYPQLVFRAYNSAVDPIYAPDRTYPAVLATLRAALAAQHHNGPGSRIYLVRTHMDGPEHAAWDTAIKHLHLVVHSIEGTGPEGLHVIGGTS
jgi:hypothetical protein